MPPRRAVRWTLVTLLAVVPTQVVAAEPALDAAMRADEVTNEHCADLKSNRATKASSAAARVAAAWEDVSKVHDQTGAAFLLFWRGVLAQCLDQVPQARADLEAFVQEHEGGIAFTDLVRRARARLKRLRLRDDADTSAAAAILLERRRFDLDARWAGGAGVQVLRCSDPGRGEMIEIDAACIDGLDPSADLGPWGSSMGLAASFDLWSPNYVGLGAALVLDAPFDPERPVSGSPRWSLDLGVGPRLRFASAPHKGRARSLHVEPSLELAVRHLIPIAGSAAESPRIGYLDPGTWRMAAVGGSITIQIDTELDTNWLLSVQGRGGAHISVPGLPMTVVREGFARPIVVDPGQSDAESDDVIVDERVERPVEAIGGMSWNGALSFSWLRPLAATPLILGPYVGLDVTETRISFPDREEDTWCVRGCSGEVADLRKVYSTSRVVTALRVGVRIAVVGAP